MKISFRKKMIILSIIPILYLYGLVIYPFGSIVYYSLFKYNIGETRAIFVGVDNFIALFSDQAFYKVLGLTFSYSFVTVVAEFALGIGIAYLLVHIRRGRSIATSILILPLVMTPAVAGIIWRLLFDVGFGHVNFYLGLLGLPPVQWLTRPTEAFFSCVIVDIWQWTPFVVLVVFAGLTTLPAELVESAYIDGATEFRTYINILLPRIQALLYIILFLRVIDTFKVFDTIYTMTSGGPGTSTTVLSIYNYMNVMTFYHIGFGCTIAAFAIILMNIIVALLSQRAGGALFEVQQ
jgi:multiple sugar transport system permease protein